MKYYLNLDFKTGRLYHYSKESQEGYDEHKNAAGNISYRKYFFKGIFGTLKALYVSDTDRGLHLKMILTQGDEFYAMLQFPMFDQKGNIDKFVESLIMVMPNLEIGKDYRVFPFITEQERDGRKFKFKGISVKEATLDGEGGGEAGEKLESAFTYQTKEDDELGENMIPRLEFEEVIKGSGKYAPTSSSVGARKDFLLKVFNQELERLDPKDQQEDAQEAAAPAKAPTKAPAKSVSKAKAVQEEELEPEEDYDDVPF